MEALQEKKFIALHEKDRNLVKWPINGISHRVVCLWAKTLFLKTVPGFRDQSAKSGTFLL
jgi:hypothetical protein